MKETQIYDLLNQVEAETNRDSYYLNYNDQLAISTKVNELRDYIKSVYDARKCRTAK